MSKTSDANWGAKKAIKSSKRFAGLVIAFAHRYRSNFFFRAIVAVIGLQFVYALIVLGLSIGAIFILYHEIVTGMIAAITNVLTSPVPLTSAAIVAQLEAVRTREVVGIVVLIVIIATFFGYLVTRYALAPTRRALEAQKRFIGNIAHELRTPLAVIKTNTEVRLFDTDVSENARELHISTLEELDRISAIVNNLLSLNTLIQPERIPFEYIDIDAISSRVIERLQNLVDKKKIKLRSIVQPDIGRIWGNATAIEQICMNLLRNAIQHTASGEVVLVAQRVSDGRSVISVSDTGSGIHQNDLRHIFEPFYRGDNARTRNGGAGSGLGLAIVHELVSLHKGSLRIRSAPGKGTVVTVILPAHTSAHRTKRRHERSTTIFNIDDLDDEIETTATAAGKR